MTDPSHTELVLQLAARGYFPTMKFRNNSFNKMLTDDLDRPVSEHAAILAFQAFHSLEQTGEFDEQTLAVLLAPRCGLPDRLAPLEMVSNDRRWTKRSVSYSIDTLPSGVARNTFASLIEQAFAVWQQHLNLVFNLAEADADIRIGFHRRDHGDGFPFDGRCSALAHAFPPPSSDGSIHVLNGDIHFDSDEIWHFSEDGAPQFDNDCGSDVRDFLTVAIHEIGHSLGLDHQEKCRPNIVAGMSANHQSTDCGSVMYPNYVGIQRNLFQIDIDNIKKLYTVPH
jgi:Matrixin/Putative peptidoglycan binding domain